LPLVRARPLSTFSRLLSLSPNKTPAVLVKVLGWHRRTKIFKGSGCSRSPSFYAFYPFCSHSIIYKYQAMLIRKNFVVRNNLLLCKSVFRYLAASDHFCNSLTVFLSPPPPPPPPKKMQFSTFTSTSFEIK